MKNSIQNYIFTLFLATLFFGSCSPSKYLQDDELLFDEVEINMETEAGFFEKRSLKSDLDNAVEPVPTKEVLGMPIRQWFYSLYPEDIPNEGFKHWVKYNLGEPPEIYKQAYQNTILRNFQNLLFNNGYFQNQVTSEQQVENRKVTLVYDIITNEAFYLDTIIYPDTAKRKMNKLIYESKNKSIINAGDQYNVEELKEERQRLNQMLKNNGFYYFNPEYILYKIDTTLEKNRVDVYMEYDKNMPARATNEWYIGDIFINTAYDPQQRDTTTSGDTFNLKNYHVLYGDEKYVQPVPLIESIILEPGTLYKLTNHQTTLNKLMGMDIFQFVNVDFSETETADTSTLTTNIDLSRRIPRSVQVEAQAVTKSNDYSGPNLNLSYLDRNLLNGAESFEVNAHGAFETQLSSASQGLNSWEFGVETDLNIPRFIIPFIDADKWLSKRYMPRTSFTTDFTFTNRVNYFNMNSVGISWGYIWQETLNKKHSFYPLNLNYMNVTQTTSRFDSLLQDRPLLEQSFREQFILSMMYSYQLTTGSKKPFNFSSLLHVNTELAGNTLHLVNTTIGSDAGTFFGTPYSQFAKIQTDLRYYYQLRNSSFANRWLVGVGYPYGNSRALPYNRQFFIGGTSSIRAFPTRSVGPGTYDSPDSLNIYTFDQSGDLKFEANLEYRFNIFKMFKGALFYDVGNIWLIKRDKDKPGGKFKFDDFFDELAMGTGFGLRIDANFVVIRIDVGVPLRDPSYPAGERWVLDNASFNDLVLNIAIGYPF